MWHSGNPNRFKDSQPLRNVFRGNSSLLARCFLLEPAFPSLVALRAFAVERLLDQYDPERETRLAKGTVSKVVQALEEQRIVLRDKEGVRLIDPALLMERLRASYTLPRGKRVEGKMPFTFAEAWKRLSETTLRYVATGDGSAGHYRVLSSGEKLSLYVENVEAASRVLEVKPGRVFPNIELLEATDNLVYFDARQEENRRWASPIQTWLELALSGPREREAAQSLEAELRNREGETHRLSIPFGNLLT